MNTIRSLIVPLAAVTLLVSGCKEMLAPPEVPAPEGARSALPDFDPDAFVEGIDHPYLGFEVGRTMRYRGETDEGVEIIEVTVTADTKTILGVDATVVHDQVFLEGDLIEDTYDWYAQDEGGNVWYLGEDSKEIEDGEVVSTEGSWEAGVDGAQAGILMWASPQRGRAYYQEYYEGEAEDEARVLSFDEFVSVAAGDFDHCWKTQEWTKLEPTAMEFKFYAPGVGMVMERAPGADPIELIEILD